MLGLGWFGVVKFNGNRADELGKVSLILENVWKSFVAFELFLILI